MSIFPNLELEDIIQLNDKTRLNATKSFVSRGSAAITKVEIEPETSAGYTDVYNADQRLWYLDWQYSSAGTKTVSCKVTASTNTTITKTIVAVSSATDSLWSADSDLISYEPEILKYVPAGRNTFLNIHRKAQNLILDWLDEQRVWDQDGARLTKASIIQTEDLKRMSCTKTLELIFEGISNKPDDVFDKKAKSYKDKFDVASERGRIRFDFNNDATQSTSENVDNVSSLMFRRG